MTSELSPYFRSLARQRRICPECLRGCLTVKPSGSGDPDAAWDACACGYRQLRLAPEGARLNTGPTEAPGEDQLMVDRLNAQLREGEGSTRRKMGQVIRFRPRA